MIEYIYFVKCPGCEDEHFDFLDAAKEFALGRLSQKPVITQTEISRNDFGECTDHCDLGTVWSWEDVMKDTESEYTEANPTISIFTKDDLKLMANGEDPEFDSIDNSVDFEVEELVDDEDITESVNPKVKFKPLKGQEDAWITEDDMYMITQNGFGRYRVSKYDPKQSKEIDTYEKIAFSPFFKTSNGAKHWINNTFYQQDNLNNRKPIPEGMTIEQLVEEMEEHEDNVECACCSELYPKEECHHDEKHGWICPNCKDKVVECTWCGELYDRSRCRYEVDLGWLCGRCEAAIKSRGETLTFREGSYWDFLNEEAKIKTWICIFEGKEIGTVTAATEEEAVEKMQKEYPEYPYGKYDGCFEVYTEDEKDYEHKEPSVLEELEEPEIYHSRLIVCPECGENKFDPDTGICSNCGFNTLI